MWEHIRTKTETLGTKNRRGRKSIWEMEYGDYCGFVLCYSNPTYKFIKCMFYIFIYLILLYVWINACNVSFCMFFPKFYVATWYIIYVYKYSIRCMYSVNKRFMHKTTIISMYVLYILVCFRALFFRFCAFLANFFTSSHKMNNLSKEHR